VRGLRSNESRISLVFEIILGGLQHTNISSIKIHGQKDLRESEAASFSVGDFPVGGDDTARQEGIPQGLKPLSVERPERAKPEGLAYLEATAMATTTEFGSESS
jgi:hypothetical protein